VKPGVTTMNALKQTVEQMRRLKVNLLGVVLNDIEPRSGQYGYYYRQYYPNKYSYYYSEDGSKLRRKKSRKEPVQSEIEE
jgi:Mrp family chromosome partitioning ATPase